MLVGPEGFEPWTNGQFQKHYVAALKQAIVLRYRLHLENIRRSR
jgi:hypothetical protein